MKSSDFLFILALVAFVTGAIWFKPGLVALALFILFGGAMLKASHR